MELRASPQADAWRVFDFHASCDEYRLRSRGYVLELARMGLGLKVMVFGAASKQADPEGMKAGLVP
jgi:hypothetical protein